MLADRKFWLSGYRMMWGLVMFDLPVMEKKQRRAYTQFVAFLQEEGYIMVQYSVYMRLYSGKEAVESFARRLEKTVPDGGDVQMIAITDKQYENIHSFRGKRRQKRQNPAQYVLL